MSRDRDREQRLAAALQELPVPDEHEAEERSWRLVEAAFAEREAGSSGRRRSRWVIAGGGVLAAVVIGLSPAGAEVGEFVSDVVGIGEEDAKPQLRALPAAGELLVESDRGLWIVREDGSRRLLGDFDQGAWSPRGLNVAVAEATELSAVDYAGELQWTLAAPGEVADPRWSPSGFRIAYRSGADLRVVAGDGTADALIARDVAPVAPAWRPIDPDSKVAFSPDGVGGHVLTYVDSSGEIRSVDVDSGAAAKTLPRDLELLSTPPTGGRGHRASSPDGSQLATIETVGGRDQLSIASDGSSREKILFSARGRLTGPTWSPDGNWVLVGWPEADQWLFIRTDRNGRVVAFDDITAQFGAGDAFPRVAGWVLPQR